MIVLLPLDDGNYLKIDIKGDGEPLEDGKALLVDEAFQSAFRMEIAETVE